MTDMEKKIRPTEIIGGQKTAEKAQAIKQEIEEFLAIKVNVPVINREWLEGRSEEELLDLILAATRELKKKKKPTTEKIAQESGDSVSFREYSEIPLESFVSLPAGKEVEKETGAWHVVMVSQEPSHKTLALKLVDDIIFGRKTEDTEPDVDLTEYDAEKHGISREHAKIKVTHDELILADLGSTNGTYHLDERLSLGKTAVLTDQNIISFGKLHFKVIIVRKPNDKKTGG